MKKAKDVVSSVLLLLVLVYLITVEGLEVKKTSIFHVYDILS